jgi:Kef-type K+ transport system membrane component KefB
MLPRSFTDAALSAAALLLLGAGLLLSNTTPHADDLGRLAFGLTIVISVALAGGHLVTRFGQPPVLGELIGGVLLGNLPGLAGLGYLATDPYIDILARLGMLLLLFEVGLELSVGDLFLVGASSLLVAAIGTLASLTLGVGVAALLMPASSTAAHVFLGAAITATSVGITARVLRDTGASRSDEAKIILGAAVVDDVLALVVLGAVTVWATSHGTGAAQGVTIGALVMKTVGFLVLAVVLGAKFTPGWFRGAARLRTSGALLAVGLGFCFALSWAASAMGLAALVGAFAAGLVLEDSHSELFVRRGERPLGELLQPMTTFLVPLFFVLVGFRMNVAVFGHPALLTLAAGLFGAAVLGKLACGAGVLNRGVGRLSVALGMLPRGEVTLVFAALGSTLTIGSAPLLDQRGYAALVAVVILTTLATPPALKWSLGRRAPSRRARPAA